jgi:hypothetical protein
MRRVLSSDDLNERCVYGPRKAVTVRVRRLALAQELQPALHCLLRSPQFGKLLMHDTDMILIDMNPNDPFDFYLDHY